MKKILMAGCLCLLTLGAMGQSDAGKKAVVVADKSEIKATVEKIDYDTREITLKGPEGNKLKMKVGDEVKNFAQIKRGDELVANFYQAVAFSLVKSGEAPAATVKTAVYTAEKGEKPAGLVVKTLQMTGTVEKINPEDREVTLKGPEGNSVQLTVDKSVGDLKRIKKGDRVATTYAEALAVAVQTPEN